MKPLFQLSTRKYDEELPLVKKAMEELEGSCKVKNGYDTMIGYWTKFEPVTLNKDYIKYKDKHGNLNIKTLIDFLEDNNRTKWGF
jgi:hypothetical protein